MSCGATQVPRSTTREPFLRAPPWSPSCGGIAGQSMPHSFSRSEGPWLKGPAEITNSWAGEGLSMSLDCQKKVVSSLDRPPLTREDRWQPPLASSDSSLSFSRTPRECGSSTAPPVENFPCRRRTRPSGRRAPKARFRACPAPNFFQVFYHGHRGCFLRPPSKPRKTWVFCAVHSVRRFVDNGR